MKISPFRNLVVVAISILSTLLAFAMSIVPALASGHNKKEVRPPRNYRDNSGHNKKEVGPPRNYRDNRHHDIKSPTHHGVDNSHSHPTVTKNPPPMVTTTSLPTTSAPPSTTSFPNPCLPPTISVPPSTGI